jgi:hypothetical protein
MRVVMAASMSSVQLQAVVDAALLLLERMGLTPADPAA